MKKWRVVALVIAAVIVLIIPCSASAEDVLPEDAILEAEENSPEENLTEETKGPEEAEGESVGEDGSSFGEDGESEEGESSDEEMGDSTAGGLFLTEDSFDLEDIPEEYLDTECDTPGTVERIRYKILGETEDDDEVKSFLVYLPAGYEDNEDPYNVIYLLHASGGSAKNYFELNSRTPLQNLIDNMIANGELDPVIIVAPNFYSSGDSFEQYMPLMIQVESISDFPAELVDYIVPAAEEAYRTYAETTDEEGLRASRDHRAVAGFSLGGTAAWNTFIQRMYAFFWYLPISEASWDDGNGGTSGIYDSDLSAQVLYDAVLDQGFTADDFCLFVATGTDDDAFEIATEQMKSLLEYDDMFITGKNTSCSMMGGGKHTLSATYVYLYHILPALFRETEQQSVDITE